MSREQLEETFFNLAPEPGESSAAFVGRIEMQRRQLGVDKQATYHTFVKLLDVEVKRSLDIVRLNKKA